MKMAYMQKIKIQIKLFRLLMYEEFQVPKI